jgi:putative NADH-flavin reductase
LGDDRGVAQDLKGAFRGVREVFQYAEVITEIQDESVVGRWLVMGSASSLEVMEAFFGAMKSTPSMIMSSCGLSSAG